MSSRDNLVTGAAACSLILDVEALFTDGAARWAATFFTTSFFAGRCFFGTPALTVVGFEPGFSTIAPVISTLLATGHRSANSGTIGGGTMANCYRYQLARVTARLN
jgi:hypothetical protein